ncbi:MAG TPA: monovalent cation/H(+) antiporter subunit G [Luteimicrobium sp.]|nr:monovalent cation/H(+) antiporter subunit G [Luteimicrobium sp.]
MSIDWNGVADVVAAICMLLGAFLAFAAGIGIVRFPDLLARMHAATKPQVLGLILMLVAVGLRVHVWSVVGMLVLVVVFQLLTAPVAAHMVGRAGFRTGKVPHEDLVVDDLTDDQEAALAEEDVAEAAEEERPPSDASPSDTSSSDAPR